MLHTTTSPLWEELHQGCKCAQNMSTHAWRANKLRIRSLRLFYTVLSTMRNLQIQAPLLKRDCTKVVWPCVWHYQLRGNETTIAIYSRKNTFHHGGLYHMRFRHFLRLVELQLYFFTSSGSLLLEIFEQVWYIWHNSLDKDLYATEGKY